MIDGPVNSNGFFTAEDAEYAENRHSEGQLQRC